MTQATEGPRARYRRQVMDEVRARAWEQISHGGPSGVSLKAIATAMGMTAPALYRYYGSRDELLTELILSTYQDLADLAEAANQVGNSAVDRLVSIANALRRWAVDHPQRYLLLYGTPVPGYHAPDSATALAQRIFAPIVDAFGVLVEDKQIPTDSSLSPDSSVALRRALTFWTRLHGVLSLELAGHFNGMDVDAEELYRDEIGELVGPAQVDNAI